MDDDLAIDEDLTLLQRVVRYTSSAVSVQRLVYCRELGACAEQVGAPTALAELVPLLKPLGSDPEPPVRHALAEQIVAFARVLLADPDATAAPPSAEGAERAADAAAAAAAAPTAYATVISEIVPLLSELLSGSGAQELGMENTSAVCEAASEALVELAAELRADDIGPTVLTAVLCLAHDNDVEENRVVATQLLGNLAPTIGRELCCQFVVHEIVSLADDPVFRVRKAAALKIGALCSVVGEELSVARLLPVFEVRSRC